MKEIIKQLFDEERSLFKSKDLSVQECEFFGEGESPLKECEHLSLVNNTFKNKYPLWYCNHVSVSHNHFDTTARAGIWYTNHFEMNDSTYEGEKGLRRMQDVKISHTDFTNAVETLWYCKDIHLSHINITNGDYFGLGCENIYAEYVELDGKYTFDGCKNIELHHVHVTGRDCLWNCENVTVYDSEIDGAYIAWNSKNVTFVRCKLNSLQGLCYMDHVTLIDCDLLDTDRCFEYCTNIDASITSKIVSVINPVSGVIKCKGIDTLIQDDPDINKDEMKIIVE